VPIEHLAQLLDFAIVQFLAETAAIVFGSNFGFAAPFPRRTHFGYNLAAGIKLNFAVARCSIGIGKGNGLSSFKN
jgi:hypothetical protein